MNDTKIEWADHTLNRDPWTRCDDCEERGWVPDPVRGIQWLITGGESGAKARPSHPDWFRSLRHQCEAAGVAFHFKQWGEFGPPGDDGFRRPVAEWKAPDGTITQTFRVGKHAAGRLLDGRTHDDFPTAGTTRHEATT